MIRPAQANVARATIPPGHPLEMWEQEEAAKRLRVSEDKLSKSRCPRVKWDGRVLYDPIETIAWVRLHLTHVVTPQGESEE